MIIGVSGKIGSGKTQVAKYIQNYFPHLKFKRVSFGYDVKKVASFLTGINMKTILSRKAKSLYLPEWGMTLGQMFQRLATDAIRYNLHPDAWVLSTFSKYTSNQNWVIDDVRFINEADAIRDRGGLIIRLEGDPKDLRKNDSRDHNHPSETQLDDYPGFSIIYENKPPLENLDDLMKMIKNKI